MSCHFLLFARPSVTGAAAAAGDRNLVDFHDDFDFRGLCFFINILIPNCSPSSNRSTNLKSGTNLRGYLRWKFMCVLPVRSEEVYHACVRGLEMLALLVQTPPVPSERSGP